MAKIYIVLSQRDCSMNAYDAFADYARENIQEELPGHWFCAGQAAPLVEMPRDLVVLMSDDTTITGYVPAESLLDDPELEHAVRNAIWHLWNHWNATERYG